LQSSLLRDAGLLYFILFFWWDWGLNSGLHTSTLCLTPSVHFDGYFGDGALRTICLGWPQTVILPISVSQVARITGVSHQARGDPLAHLLQADPVALCFPSPRSALSLPPVGGLRLPPGGRAGLRAGPTALPLPRAPHSRILSLGLGSCHPISPCLQPVGFTGR
jgi:hypothetical protein